MAANFFAPAFGSTVLSLTAPYPFPVSGWVYVTNRFRNFLNSISLTEIQMNDGYTKIRGIVKCLNQNYYQTNAENTNHMVIGSWGKQTLELAWLAI
jgi:hypothetical protein